MPRFPLWTGTATMTRMAVTCNSTVGRHWNIITKVIFKYHQCKLNTYIWCKLEDVIHEKESLGQHSRQRL